MYCGLERLSGETYTDEESQLYVKVIVGNKTWYWNKETGEFDGTSFKVAEGQL